MSDTLTEAEEEHWLDCPDADFFIRAGSQLLDGILCFLILSGITHLTNASVTLLPKLLNFWPQVPLSISSLQGTIFYLSLVAKISVVYIQFIWTVSVFGGTPAKLLLGLRVVDVRTGSKLELPRVFLREVVGKGVCVLTAGTGFLPVLFRGDRRGAHDLLCKSVVKRVHEGP